MDYFWLSQLPFPLWFPPVCLHLNFWIFQEWQWEQLHLHYSQCSEMQKKLKVRHNFKKPVKSYLTNFLYSLNSLLIFKTHRSTIIASVIRSIMIINRFITFRISYWKINVKLYKTIVNESHKLRFRPPGGKMSSSFKTIFCH